MSSPKVSIVATTLDGRPLKLLVAAARGAAPIPVRKHPSVAKRPADEQAAAAWYVRLRRPDGRDTWIQVGSADLPLAQIAAAAVDAFKAAGSGADRYAEFRHATAARTDLTLAQVIDEYLKAGCPDRSLRARPAAAIAREKTDLTRLRKTFGDRAPSALTTAVLDAYARERGAPRAVDLELAALANACAYAVRSGRLDNNPLDGRPRYRDARDVEHCYHHQPASDEELHALARDLLSRPATVVSGARMLLEAMTGLRRSEPLQLRWDARELGPGRWQPGARLTDAGKRDLLVVARAKNGRNPGAVVHAALADFLGAWRSYHARRWPTSPWYFPGAGDGEQPARLDQLGRDLQDAAKRLGLPSRTSHGLRAYYVSVRRSQGIDDLQIAAELGQRSGAGLVASVYGDPGTLVGDMRLDWLPKNGEPAWRLLEATETGAAILPMTANA